MRTMGSFDSILSRLTMSAVERQQRIIRPPGRPRGSNPETNLVRACLQLLSVHRIWARRQNSGAVRTQRGQLLRFGVTGAADITGILPNGIRLEIECKMPGRHPTPEQGAFLQAIRANNGVALVVHSVQELIDKLRNVLPSDSTK